jgi:hypothetical protein
MQPSKSVSRESTSDPFETGWMSWASETLSLGRKTMEGCPPRRA